MAKKSKKKEDETKKVVANCDLKNLNIESLIRTIRGQKVMVDFDLAMLYGVLNKRHSEQVKRNIERFPDDFMFQLTKEEWNTLRSQIATANIPEDKAIALLRSQFANTKTYRRLGHSHTHLYNMVMFYEAYISEAFRTKTDSLKLPTIVQTDSAQMPPFLTLTTSSNHVEILNRCKDVDRR